MIDEWIRGADPCTPDTVAQVPLDVGAVDDDQWGRRRHVVIAIASLACEEFRSLDSGEDDWGIRRRCGLILEITRQREHRVLAFHPGRHTVCDRVERRALPGTALSPGQRYGGLPRAQDIGVQRAWTAKEETLTQAGAQGHGSMEVLARLDALRTHGRSRMLVVGQDGGPGSSLVIPRLRLHQCEVEFDDVGRDHVEQSQ